MAFQNVTRTTAADGTFAVTAVQIGANGQALFYNNTQAGITGTVSIVRTTTGSEFTGSFQLDLEPGEAYMLRNQVADTDYTYTGSFKHTIVKAHLPFQYDSSKEEAYDATGQRATAGDLAAIVVEQI